jgi:hypothetical protein
VLALDVGHDVGGAGEGADALELPERAAHGDVGLDRGRVPPALQAVRFADFVKES